MPGQQELAGHFSYSAIWGAIHSLVFGVGSRSYCFCVGNGDLLGPSMPRWYGKSFVSSGLEEIDVSQ